MKDKTTRLRHRDVQDAIELMNGRWRGAILACLCEEGPKRFSELKTILNPVTAKVLINELRYLEWNLMVYAEKSTETRNSIVYGMTEHGKTLAPVIYALQNWSLQHRSLMFKKLSEQVF